MNLDMFSCQHEEDTRLSVLSCGLGQDSTALLYQYAYNDEFRKRYAPNDFLVIFADTGNEFSETYTHLSEVKVFCQAQKIEFVHLSPDMGYHTGDWQSLQHFYEAKSAIGSKAYPKICSQRLKIDPIYRYLEDHLSKIYGVKSGKKKGFRQFAKESGKIRMIIGIAAGEEKRMSVAEDRKERWYRESITHEYPLVDMNMNRAKCQEYIKSVGHNVPIPSNCVMCPFLSEQELEYIRRFCPTALEEWIYFERKKLDKWSHLNAVPVVSATGKTTIVNKNLGVWGKRTLPQMVEIVREKYASWSDERIIEYRFSHGHCVTTSY